MTSRKLRVLCLHGWRTSNKVLQVQMVGLQQALGGKDGVEFVSLNAPFPAKGPAHAEVETFFGKAGHYYEWWDHVEEPATDTTPKRNHYVGFPRSLAFLQGQVDALGPFDAVLGFSQGAAMTTLLTAHYLAQGAVPYKAVMLFCGLLPRDAMPEALRIADGNYHLNIPSLHVLGEVDPIFSWGQKLVGAYESSTRNVYIHPDGHKFPTLPKGNAMYTEIAAALRAACK
ncbi:serine hydrolase (FSH1)-like protein [Achlya hypogyna]|uniref:Serine hydrolase (FSH1)-like protein n=1 Tax=Achlya hypogyna TaxID=1202772 RepID=A0A1V9ZK12_ACHHY|nr:serine hydrolase (FSH1)-like protein [Achlya hypogyna]